MVSKARCWHAVCLCALNVAILSLFAECLVWSAGLTWGPDEAQPASEAARHLEGEESLEDARTARAAEKWGEISGLIQFAVMVIVLVVEISVLVLYWCCYIKNTPEKYIPPNAVVPADLKGRWLHGIFDCTGACGTCLCFTFFPVCAMADLWYRAGWVHAMMHGEMQREQQQATACCPGFEYFLACCGYMLLQETGCTPCALAVLRGGMPSDNREGLGIIVDHTRRFQLPHAGFSTFCEDCCLHCWCGPCAATQEYRQVKAVIDRGIQVAAPIPLVGQIAVATVVGQPVQVVGEVVKTNNN